jgi:nucleotide-binding universal stress UspA family protein
MFKHILIASDGSQLAQQAETAGLELAKQLGAQVTAVTVTEPWDSLSMAAQAERNIANPVAGYEESIAAEAKRVLEGVKEAAKQVGVICTTLHVKDSQPAAGIIVAAKEGGCDLIVMASHGRRGISRALLGSQATKVVTLSSVPVLVCR